MRKHSRLAVIVAAGMGILAGIALMTAFIVWSNGNVSAARSLEATPEPLSVGQLVAFCQRCNADAACRAVDQVAIGYCRGFVAGVMVSRADLGLCMPKDWDTGKASKLFLRWAERHPERGRNSAADEIMRAHAAAFDCRKAGHGV